MKTVAVENLVEIKGISFPEGEKFRQIIVTGPPGSGKSTMIAKLGGWPEEGYLDLGADNWWRNRILTLRPREVHFGIPFRGFQDSMAVFDEIWLASPRPIDFERVRIPPGEPGVLGTNWRQKYVFDFLLPDPALIYQKRQERVAVGNFPVDEKITLEQVRKQVSTYWELAFHFHRQGMSVFIRNSYQGEPRYFVDD